VRISAHEPAEKDSFLDFRNEETTSKLPYFRSKAVAVVMSDGLMSDGTRTPESYDRPFYSVLNAIATVFLCHAAASL
jgi:hypothetical protein